MTTLDGGPPLSLADDKRQRHHHRVTAEDGTTKSYTVTVTRTPLSTDSSLKTLSLKDVEDTGTDADASLGVRH